MKRQGLKIERIVLALFIVATLARALSVYYAYTNFNTGESSAATARHIHHVMDAVYQIKTTTVEVENSSNKYTLSHKPEYARLTSQNAAVLNKCVENLVDSVKNSSLELQKVDEIEKLVSDMEKTLPGTDSMNITAAEREPRIFRAELPENLINGIISKSNELITEEQRSLDVWRSSVVTSRRQSIDNAYITAATGLLFVLIILIFLNKDIIRRKTAEAKSKENEERLRKVLEEVGDVIYSSDHAGKFTFINSRLESLAGYTIDELIGKDFNFLVHPDWIGKVKEFYELQFKNRIYETRYEFPIITKQGEKKWVEQNVVLVSNGKMVEGFQCVVRDITERKNAEETIIKLNKNLARYVAELEESQRFYRTVAHNFPDGTITVLDRNMNYIFVDGLELAREGLSPDRLTGTPYLNRFPAGTRNDIKKKLTDIFGGNNITFEAILSENYYIIHGAPLRNIGTDVVEILLVKQNINKLKQAEVNMKAALEKEKLINELKSRFVSLASHEFRTPLSTILSSTELIGEYIEHVEQDPVLIKEKNIHHLKRIKTAIQNMVNTLNSFLSLDQLEQGKTLTQPLEFDVKILSEEIIDGLQENLKNGQKIIYSHQSATTAIFMDRAILQNVASNLLTNAIKYSPENSVIHYTTKVTQNGLEFTVEDNGIGIPETEQANLFERFFRAKNTLNIEGTGLGLSIVKKYIDLLNGHISFTSRENEGSIFKVFIANAIPINKNSLSKQENA